MSAHTPGPWKVIQSSVKDLAVTTNRGNIAEWPTNYDSQDVADARLIAAAPDLLEALRALVECVDNDETPSDDLMESIRGLLAKAEGQSSHA